MSAEVRADYTQWLWEQQEAKRETAAARADVGSVPVAVINAHARKLRDQR